MYSKAQLVLQVDDAGAKLGKEPKRCLLGHKSSSLCTVDVLEGGLSIAFQNVLVKQQIAVKAPLSTHDATSTNIGSKESGEIRERSGNDLLPEKWQKFVQVDVAHFE
ncbi:hypothetical protein KIN20_034484 [Parelaphostrongylus tenuis]|uniref:Uncharacterized protein n=1 Tax=Parelaphostrongylus tenuis TaxID=148309 RepID=A0AAD5R9Q1_PARTN|nr:hypothetical protein KIN20_034484 [Parelaphostrongylus tenuis]